MTATAAATAALLLLLITAALPAATAVGGRSASVGRPVLDPAWPGGGFPALPWASWSLRDSTTAVFLGNTSGSNDGAETAREATLGVVGLGWQYGLWNGRHQVFPGGLEVRQRAAAEALKALRPGVKVVVSGDIDVTFDAWRVSAELMSNGTLRREVFMTWPNGSVWTDNKWAGLWKQPWYNFSSAVAVDWWVNHGPIAAAMQDDSLDGIYLDGANGDEAFFRDNFPTDAALRGYQQAQARALSTAVSVWRQRRPNKWLGGYVAGTGSFKNPPGSSFESSALKASPSQCADRIRLLIQRSSWRNQTLIAYTGRTASWTCSGKPPSHDVYAVPCKLQHRPHDISASVGAFLISRGPSALLELAVQPERSLDYPAEYPALQHEPGHPLEQAREISAGVFQRRFSGLTVTFDCQHFNASFQRKTAQV